MAAFGKDIMKKEFMLDHELTFLNHGSYGAAPRRVLDYRMGLITKMEQLPDVWFRMARDPLWEANVNVASEFVGANPDNLVLVGNATTGLNSVIRSLDLTKGDGILLQTWTYFCVVDTSRYVADCKGLEVLVVNIPLPVVSVQQLLDSYEQMLKEHTNIRLVVLDYITSYPSVLMPVKELIALCRRYNKLILVDGAHVPGQCRLNLEELGADFFVGNFHKWCFAPRGCAFLWIQPSFHDKIFPAVMSSYNKGNIHAEFSLGGTQDTTQLFSVGEAINFYNDIGGFDAISEYCTSLVTKGTELLVQRWGTEQLSVPEEMRSPYIRMVRLPQCHGSEKNEYPPNLTMYVWEKYRIQAVFGSISSEDPRLWVRLSAMVYNVLEDFENLADAILELSSGMESFIMVDKTKPDAEVASYCTIS